MKLRKRLGQLQENWQFIWFLWSFYVGVSQFNHENVLCKYLFYWLLYFLVTLSAMNPVMFQFSERIKQLFESQGEVGQISDFWEVNTFSLE